MAEDNKNMAEDSRRESGEPGGGQGRRDEVGQSPVYPVSAGKLPADDEAYIRTPGELGQRGRGLEGYSDHGGSGLTGLSSDAGDAETAASSNVQPGNQPAGNAAGASKVPGAGEETAASDTVDSDQDPPSQGHGDITRF